MIWKMARLDFKHCTMQTSENGTRPQEDNSALRVGYLLLPTSNIILCEKAFKKTFVRQHQKQHLEKAGEKKLFSSFYIFAIFYSIQIDREQDKLRASCLVYIANRMIFLVSNFLPILFHCLAEMGHFKHRSIYNICFATTRVFVCCPFYMINLC